jgi:hypothetical protein
MFLSIPGDTASCVIAAWMLSALFSLPLVAAEMALI